MRRLARTIALAAAIALPAAAQDQTILVLDASGSMWGQIDGTAKIDIARSVMGDLVNAIPPDQALGLTVYGHRTRGDCTDIETLVAPGAGTRDAIRSAVGAITPRGSTPLTEAVRLSAESMRYTEQRATVILVSDGRETCEADPCAVGAALEAAGIDFTAHVVGFDIESAEDRAQLECLANATGGLYRDASSAGELSAVLTEITEAPVPHRVDFVAIEGPEGPAITETLIWDVTAIDGTSVASGEAAPTLALDLPAGEYIVDVLRPSTEEYAGTEFDVGESGAVGETGASVTVVFPAPAPLASVTPPASAPLGSIIEVPWEGPGAARDYLSVARPGEDRYVNYAYAEQGNPRRLLMPPQPGGYEIRYQSADGTILAAEPIEITDVPAAIDAPDTAAAGEVVMVGWTGPDYERDYISVGPEGERYIEYSYTEQGNPRALRMPNEPGAYTIRYQLQQGGVILAERPITVTDVPASLDAPATAYVGEPVMVGWEGPDYERDYISVAEPGAGTRYINYSYTAQGNPRVLSMPTVPGSYEIRYQLHQGGRVIARRPIEVLPLDVTLDAPDTVGAGSVVMVGWEGPNYERDYISVAEPGAGERYIEYSYTAQGNPRALQMPVEPGLYEIRYQLHQNGEIVARRPIEVSDVSAALTVAPVVAAGANLLVEWDGPNNEEDFLSLVVPGETSSVVWKWAKEKSPIVLRMPPEPGIYDLRYVARGDEDRVIALQSIEVTPVSATVEAPAEVVAGEPFAIRWEGPDYDGDYISIVHIERDEGAAWFRVGDSPSVMVAPDLPGRYSLGYYMDDGDHLIGSTPVTVLPPEF